MRVLLTGSAGFIGGAIARLMAADGHEVVGVDIMLPQAHGATEPPPGTHRLDVRAAPEWVDLLKGIDAVCHQAAMVGAGTDASDLPTYAMHNDLGTAALLAAMHTARVRRLVLASSMVVYGEGHYSCPDHGLQVPPPRREEHLRGGVFENRCTVCAGDLEWQPVPESARLDPRSSYAASKVAQEHYASAWARQSGGRVAALRYHNVYGPGMPRDTPYSGVAAMFRSSLERGDSPRVFEDGGQLRDFVHVDDVARANALALAATGVGPDGFDAYNVCSGTPVTIGEVAGLVAKGSDSALVPNITGGYRLGDVRHVVASPELAATDLGFRAEIGPAAGLPAFATAPLRN